MNLYPGTKPDALPPTGLRDRSDVSFRRGLVGMAALVLIVVVVIFVAAYEIASRRAEPSPAFATQPSPVRDVAIRRSGVIRLD